MIPSILPRYHQLVLGVLLGLWLYALLVLLAPYDAAPISFNWRVKLMLGYGVIFALSYQLAHLFEVRFFQGNPLSWWAGQIRFLLVFMCLNFPLTFWYYKSPIVLGEYTLFAFATQVYLTTLVVIIPLMLYGRKRIEQLSAKVNTQVVLRGENKLDILQLAFKELLYIETARNYVEVHYRQGETTRKKLLRTTLKRIANEHPEFLQTHRSYLVNPLHVNGWRNAKSLSLGDQEIPVSDSYRSQVEEYLGTHP